MKKDLAKTYDPKSVEDRLYATWMEKKYFHAEVDHTKKPYTIMMPPPNITGRLHMGHVSYTIQDILTRTKRMQGYNALWMPGTDHASIATEARIINKLAKDGITKNDIGREAFLEKAWEWKEEYAGLIEKLLMMLGSSCDWDRERFTMDEGLSKAVTEVFLRLYEKGYIYRGEKLINWCPKCKTTISDAEVEHEDKEGYFWHFKYKIKDTDEYITFATTRPETMLGDTAVAVNPKDTRYTHLVGKTVVVPVVNREIPIIADEYVEMDFGTGVVKITPAHDPNDFEVGERHKLPRINILNDDGTLNENAGTYAGLGKLEAREKLIEEFKQLGQFVKAEKITHAVGTHDRCDEVIEPIIKLQWFVKMEEMAKPAVDVYKSGKMRIVPERFGKIYMNWLDNIRDWCISRQLWWGHRIPAYYCTQCGHIEVAREMPASCSECGCGHLVQDEDTLDTWFSSALWPFSTLGWPDDTEELKYFYPTNVLDTAYDIIFFWVVRMVFSGIEQMGEIPFHDVLIHGLVRDSLGRKMSKSLDNGVDPMEVIEQYGADALRLAFIMGNTPGNDMRFYYEKVEASRNFSNKIWNASRFVLMNMEEDEQYPDNVTDMLTPADKWILSKVNTLAKEVTGNIDSYELGMAVQKIYDFIWDEYCDWYIEMVKPRLYNPEDPTRIAALWTLKKVLVNALKLLHPYMPFITEEIFMAVQSDEETIMLSHWPEYDDAFYFEEDEKEIDILKEAIKNIRNIRAEMNVPPSKKTHVYIVSPDAAVRGVFERGRAFFATLSYASGISVQPDRDGIGDNAIPIINSGSVAYLPFEQLLDVEKEIERLTKESERLDKEVARLEGRLANEGFVAKAPAAVVAEDREKLEKYIAMKKQTGEQLEMLRK